MQFLQKYSLFEKMTIVIVNTANTPQAPTLYVFHIIKKHTTIYNNIRRGYLSLIIRKIYDVRYPCPDLLYIKNNIYRALKFFLSFRIVNNKVCLKLKLCLKKKNDAI